jgi:hypothetical protein
MRRRGAEGARFGDLRLRTLGWWRWADRASLRKSTRLFGQLSWAQPHSPIVI